MAKGFQILDENKNPITINELDRQVCEIVGNEVDPKNYCLLAKESELKTFKERFNTSNWFDTIGWMIASDGKSFQDIIDYYNDVMKEFIGKEDENGEIITIEIIYPYHIALLKSWIAKGYEAKSVEY